MKTYVKVFIPFLLFLIIIYVIPKADISSRADDKIRTDDKIRPKGLHDQEKCPVLPEEVSVPVGSPAVLSFHVDVSSRTVDRWTWMKDGADLCFCRGKFQDIEFKSYESRIKFSCEDVARGDATLRFSATDLSDAAVYTVRGDGAIYTCPMKLVITSAATEPTGTAHEAEKPSNNSNLNGTNNNEDGNTGWSAGGVVGGVFGLCLLIGLGFFIWCKCRPQSSGAERRHGDGTPREKTQLTGASGANAIQGESSGDSNSQNPVEQGDGMEMTDWKPQQNQQGEDNTAGPREDDRMMTSSGKPTPRIQRRRKTTRRRKAQSNNSLNTYEQGGGRWARDARSQVSV